jgi:hypothetical protein
MSDERARYVETLKLERGMVAQRPDSPKNQQRIAEIDRVLDTYSDEPKQRQRETPETGAEPAARRPRKSAK